MQRGNIEMAKTVKPRELSIIEQGFIESKRHLTPDELFATYFVDSGVAQEDIAAHLTSLPALKESEADKAKKKNPYDKDKTAEENRRALAMNPMTAGNQMIRDTDRPGIAIMTEAASELTDARRAAPSREPARDNSGHIFKINKNKK